MLPHKALIKIDRKENELTKYCKYEISILCYKCNDILLKK